MKKKRKDLEGGRCLIERDRRLDFIEDRAKNWKKRMEKFMTQENK